MWTIHLWINFKKIYNMASHVITFNLDRVDETDGAGDAVKARAYDDHIPLIARIDCKHRVTVKLGSKHTAH